MRRARIRWFWWLAAAAVAALLTWSFMPAAISVDTARVARGAMIVTIDEDGRTRVRERYTVSAPTSGYLTRVQYRAGASVDKGQTVATILPAPPAPIDARTRSQLEARLEASIDALRQARTRVESARATLAQADRELERYRQLERDRVVAAEELEMAATRRRVAEAELNAASAGTDVAEHDVQAARGALLAGGGPLTGRRTDIRAPRAGAILRVFEESERAIEAGTPVLEIGAPTSLEIVADLLSTDAVQVRAGARVLIERWGGSDTLNGCVRIVEPSSFTKVSALGVEEQRVNVIIDLTDPPRVWARLGDGFAVEVRVVVWEAGDTLKVPTSALFRRGTEWSVYKVVAGRAVDQRVRIGRRNDVDAAVESGLGEGDVVVLHPSDRVAQGTKVTPR